MQRLSSTSHASTYRAKSNRWRLGLLLGSTLALLLSISQAQANPYSTKAARVVSIDGSITEIIYALGAQGRLVGVDTTSRYPQAATALPQVGYMRQLSVEGILSLMPDLVLATPDAGPESVFDQLKQAGVWVTRIDNRYSLQGVLNKVDAVARAIDHETAGEALKLRIRQQTEQALAQIPDASAQAAPKTLFLLGAGNRGLMAAGNNTQAAAMLDLVRAHNAVSYEGYKPMSAEGALQAAPEAVIVGHTQPGNTGVLNETLAMTPASQNQRIHSVDVGLVLGFGPRLPEAVDQLVQLIWRPAGASGHSAPVDKTAQVD